MDLKGLSKITDSVFSVCDSYKEVLDFFKNRALPVLKGVYDFQLSDSECKNLSKELTSYLSTSGFPIPVKVEPYDNGIKVSLGTVSDSLKPGDFFYREGETYQVVDIDIHPDTVHLFYNDSDNKPGDSWLSTEEFESLEKAE